MAKKKMMSRSKMVMTLLCFLVVFSCAFTLISKVLQLRKQEAAYAALVKQEKVLMKERSALEGQVKKLDDEDYVVKYARDHYIFTKDDENAVVLPSESSSKK